MIITIRGKDFKIELVSNYVRKLYSEMDDLATKINNSVHETNDLIEEHTEKINAANEPRDRRKLSKEYREKNKEIIQSRKKWKDEIIKIRNDIIIEVLKKNEIKYDENWWDRETDVDDLNDFVVQCFKTDSKKKAPKKK